MYVHNPYSVFIQGLWNPVRRY